MTYIYYRNEKFVTGYNERSKIPSTSWCFATRVQRSPLFSLELIFASLCVGSSVQNASEQFVSCIHFSLAKCACHGTPQKRVGDLNIQS